MEEIGEKLVTVKCSLFILKKIRKTVKNNSHFGRNLVMVCKFTVEKDLKGLSSHSEQTFNRVWNQSFTPSS